MKKPAPLVLAVLALLAWPVMSASQPLGQPGVNIPAGIAPEQGYVPEAWAAHEGGLLRYRVAIRFGLEPSTLPEGFQFGRVSAVTHDTAGNVYVFHRGDADPIVVFDSTGRYLRSFGHGLFGNEHGLRIDRAGNIWAIDNGDHMVYEFSNDGTLLREFGTRGVAGSDEKTFARPTDIAFDSRGFAYISDGYTNTRVVKLSPDGNFVKSWGELKPDKIPLSDLAKLRKTASELVDKVRFDAGPNS